MDIHRLAQRMERTIEALEALPGVDAATMCLRLPGVPHESEDTFELIESRSDIEREMVSEPRGVSPGYFRTLQIPLVDGEHCRPQVPGAARDVVVNQAFVTRYLSGRPSPVGLHLKQRDDTDVHRIVGVVGNARERGLNRPPGPTVYWCGAWNPMPYFLVRTRGEPLSAAQAVRLKIKELDPERSVYEIAPLEERIGQAFTENRLRAALLILFAVTALSIACVGSYGTLSYVISLRRREIGLHMALGALRRDILRRFVVQALRVAAIACACGLALSLASAGALSSMLYGVSPTDPATLAGVIAMVLLVAAFASLLPSIRAARMDPMHVLRDE